MHQKSRILEGRTPPSGTYEETTIDASGKPVKHRGKYVEILEKQSDGKWKCGTDIWNSDLPVGPAEKK